MSSGPVRFILMLVGAGLALLVLAMSLLGWALYRPERAMGIVAPAVLPRNMKISWASGRFDTHRAGGLRWKVDWAMSGVKIDRVDPRTSVVLDLKLVGEIALDRHGLSVQIANFEAVNGGSAVWDWRPDKEASASKSYQRLFSIRSWLDRLNRFVTVEKVKLSVADLELQGVAAALKIKFEAVKAEPGKPLSSRLDLADAHSSMQLQSDFHTDQIQSGGVLLKGSVKGHCCLGADGFVDVTYELSGSAAQMALAVKGQAGGAPVSTFDARMVVEPARFSVTGNGDLQNLKGPVAAVKGANWSLDGQLSPGTVLEHLPAHLTMSAPLDLTFIDANLRKTLEKSCICEWPKSAKVQLDGKVWAFHLFGISTGEQPVAAVHFKFEDIKNRLIDLRFEGDHHITRGQDGVLAYSTSVDTELKIPEFQTFKVFLEANQIQVRPPFDILQGTLSANVKSALWKNERGLVIPMEARANLSSPEQKVDLSSKVTLHLADDLKSMDVMLDTVVNEFLVEMPPIDPIEGFPQWKKESATEGTAKDQDSPFKVWITYGLRTSKPGAIRLLSKLAKPAVPITLDLDRTSKGDTLGSVRTEPFELNYQHRSMHIDHLRVIVDDRESADYAIDGLIRIENAQYKIGITVSGSLRSPLIKVNSEPELARSEILSVLLYDRTIDQITAADRAIVATFEAAVADRLVGLLGLWVFASTQIQSFSYDAASKTYRGTVRLAEGATAQIGSEWEEAAQLQARKLVTRNWTLTAVWRPGPSKDQTGSWSLQWEKRR